jgi:hypothetical protein
MSTGLQLLNALDDALANQAPDHVAEFISAEGPDVDDEVTVRRKGYRTRQFASIQLAEHGHVLVVNEYTYDDDGDLDGAIPRKITTSQPEAVKALMAIITRS